MTTTEPTAVALVAALKPRLRGWLHAYAAAVSIVTGVVMVAVVAALRGTETGVVTAIYAATVTLLFGTSALYHRRTWSPRGQAIMRRLDHSMIFVFIAGTYTPIAALALTGTASTAILVTVWAGAGAGVALKVIWPGSPRWLSVPLYIGLGWAAVFVMPQILHNVGVAALVLIVIGGACYTIGGVVYGLKRPDPYPGTFGFHEVFHAATLVAALCHYVAIWLTVLR